MIGTEVGFSGVPMPAKYLVHAFGIPRMHVMDRKAIGRLIRDGVNPADQVGGRAVVPKGGGAPESNWLTLAGAPP